MGPAKVCRLSFSGLWPKTAPPRARAHYLQAAADFFSWPVALPQPPHGLWPLPEPPPHGLWPTSTLEACWPVTPRCLWPVPPMKTRALDPSPKVRGLWTHHRRCEACGPCCEALGPCPSSHCGPSSFRHRRCRRWTSLAPSRPPPLRPSGSHVPFAPDGQRMTQCAGTKMRCRQREESTTV